MSVFDPFCNDRVFLIDGSNFIFRAYYQSIRQDKKYQYRSDGLPTGALRLFAVKLFQFMREGALDIMPTHLCVVFDKPGKSFRKEIYPDYKIHRSAPPDDLISQFPLMRQVVKAFGLCSVEMDYYEADDIIATYSQKIKERGGKTLIISADKDLMQLVGPDVAMYDPASGRPGESGSRAERYIDEAAVFDYFGVYPNRVIDVQSLSGDASDNIPGAPGIGVKTAAKLINDYGSLDNLLSRASEISQNKRRLILTDPEVVKSINISRRLVTLYDQTPVTADINDMSLRSFNPERLLAFFKAMEFGTLAKRVADMYKIDLSKVEACPELSI
jgi:DNA polymerase-1